MEQRTSSERVSEFDASRLDLQFMDHSKHRNRRTHSDAMRGGVLVLTLGGVLYLNGRAGVVGQGLGAVLSVARGGAVIAVSRLPPALVSVLPPMCSLPCLYLLESRWQSR